MKEASDYTDIQRHAGNRAGLAVSVRLKPDEAELLRALSERDGRTLSETLRVALNMYAHQPPPETTVPGDEQSFTRGGVFANQPAETDLIFVG
jgi:Ribbon-helix-helix protein, copG family